MGTTDRSSTPTLPIADPLRPRQSGDPADKLRHVLDESCACLQTGWPGGHAARTALAQLRDRLQDARLQVAVLGQFKRGKSTFINALLGSPLLPSAVVPATAIPTFITWAPSACVRATFQDGRAPEEVHPEGASAIQEQLHAWVTEEGNPVNQRGIARVDLCVPAEVLRDGIVLVDTPGIGSTFQHNSDMAMQVLPECDAGLFVVSADPMITAAEIAYLADVRQHVVQLFFVLNKIDYLAAAERTQALRFVRTALQRAGQAETEPRIYALSARQALEAKVRGDDAAVEASGLGEIEREVLSGLAREKMAALYSSVRAKAASAIDRSLSDVALQVRALELPLEDLEQRSHALADALRSTQQERQAAQDLLEGDRHRAVAELETQAEQMRREGRDALAKLAQEIGETGDGGIDRDAIQQALHAAVPTFFAERLVAVASGFRQTVEAMLTSHQARADALVGSVRRIAATLFDVPLRATEETEAFRLGREPYWVTQPMNGVLVPSPATLVSRLLPAALRRARLRKEMEARIDALVQHNVENLRWATLQAVNETFRRFSAQLDQRLSDVLAMTQGAIRQAIERRQATQGQASAELDHWRGIADRLASLRSAL